MRLFARIGVAVATVFVVAVASTPAPLIASSAHPPAQTHVMPTPRTDSMAPRTLIWAVDGLSFEAFTEARRRGLFSRFTFAGRHVAPYPSMSHASWTELTGARRLFGPRGALRSVEASWFDLDEMRVADDPRQVFARQAGPFNYMRGFDWYFDPLVEPLMYFEGERLVERELAEAERAVLENFTGRHHVAFIGAADALAHTHLNGLHPYLRRLDAMMSRVLDSLATRGGVPVHSWIISDHGNAGAFAEGKPERRLKPVSLDATLRTAGLVRQDTGSLTRSNSVSIVTLALASMIDVYFADLGRRRSMANAAVRQPGVDVVTWLEVSNTDRRIVIIGADSGEAELRWRDDGAVSYTTITGNPLGIPAQLANVRGTAARWVPDTIMREATEGGAYPDAAFRLVRSASKDVENAPDLIVNLRDGYCWAGTLGRYVQMVRTHGALSRRSTLGLVASTHDSLPPYLRSEEVLARTGVEERALFARALTHAPHDARLLAESLAVSPAQVATGRDDQHPDAEFLRRVRPLTLSAEYFDWGTLRALTTTLTSDSTARAAQRRQLTRAQRSIQRAEVVNGVTRHLDTLLALGDGLPPVTDLTRNTVRRLLDDSEARLRTIPELSPLATLRRDLRISERSRETPAEALRRALMAAWTVPFFVDAALVAPESDSIADPRDRQFARAWHGSLRDSVREHPARILDDSTIAPRLFTELLAERELTRRVDGATVPLLYDAPLRDVTVVYVPGIFDELFDREIWQRAVRSVRERLGVRIVNAGTDGRCSARDNATMLLSTLKRDTERRLSRGYPKPRYLIIGYSKGGVDASEALLRDRALAEQQVIALVTIATPHSGSPVAERADISDDLLRLTTAAPRAASCDTTRAVESLWPANRAAFWSGDGAQLPSLVPLYSLSLVSDMRAAHPWMKITKRLGRFSEENDGVVALSASRFPPSIPSVHLGTVAGDHIAARSASTFPQESVLESVLLTLNELGAFEATAAAEWRQLVAERRRLQSDSTVAVAMATGPAITRAPTRTPQRLPSGKAGWRADKTFRMNNVESLADGTMVEATPALLPTGIAMFCDQEDMRAFRAEFAMLYDAGNGGSENSAQNGFSMITADTESGRACRLHTQRSAMKMTTVAFRFAPADFPELALRARVDREVTGVAPGKGGSGKNDAALKLWYVLRDERPASKGRRVLFGYTWAGTDAQGRTPAADSLMESGASRRRIGFSVLPEAWVMNVGGPAARGQWTTVTRNLAADIQRAYPGIPLASLRVIAITIQSDSDDSRGETDVLLDYLTMRPRKR